jgi:hypothetical protein
MSEDSTGRGSDPFCGPLPKAGGLRNGAICARPTLARRISETDSSSSLWPTATATDSKASGAAGYSTSSGRHSGTTLTDAAVRQWPTPRAADGKRSTDPKGNREGSPSLVEEARLWPTPAAVSYGTNQGGSAGRVGPVRGSLETLARQWATPTARDWRSEVATQSPEHSPPLGRQVLQIPTDGATTPPDSVSPRQLSVPFVEALMGFPIGWSDSGPTDFER